jgi:carboxypeptidase Taq
VEVMGLLGFDFEAGRLDISTHPFCGGAPQDVRITTRYNPATFASSLMGIIHETGHARYEQRLPRDTLYLPVGRARSMGIHESQSLPFEMQLARNPAFLQLVTPMVKRHLGEHAAFDAGNLARLFTRVSRSFIRVNADELTYPAHVILRFEIERALISGEIEAEDIPDFLDNQDARVSGC